MASTAHTKGYKDQGHKARPEGQANPRGRSESKPTHGKCVARQSEDHRPTGNRTGGGSCPARDRGGSMIPLGTREFHQHACSHARSQLKTIMREQRPGVRVVGCQPRREGSRVRADETVGAEKGGVDPNREVQGKATEARSQFFGDANSTGQDSQEIMQYQRAEPPGPRLHR